MHIVLFEMDRKTLNKFGDLVFQCRSLLLNRPGFVVSHVWWQANRVAHCLARASLSHPIASIFSIMYQLLCIR